jgi:hypothetical protein
VTLRTSRRTLLRGAGVALALPWLESLAPRAVGASQSADPPRRFLPVYLPNGASDFWRPEAAGSGDAWRLSSVLEPFGASLKKKLTVVSNLENGSVFNADASPAIEPSHSRLAGAWLTCVNAAEAREQLGSQEANGISVDQVLAQHDLFREKTAFPSLQLGLSTPLSNCENEPCSSSRSVSWASSTQPMYKLVDPLEVFNQLVSLVQPSNPNGSAALEAQKRVARNKSVLDAVLENAGRTRARLGVSDQRRMDEFLESVRGVERRVTGVSATMGGLACTLSEAPTLPRVEQSSLGPRQTTATYDKGLHADAMNDLIAMALECDVTRIISYMLEDERSEFTYDHVEVRAFTAQGSAPKGGRCAEYHAAQHQADDNFHSITWWNVGKVAELCQRLDAIEEAPGRTLLDSCLVLFGGSMHGGNHLANELPLALIGGSALGIENDQHVVLAQRPLRDLYFTLLNDVFELGVASFGQNLTGAPPSSIVELLKA